MGSSIVSDNLWAGKPKGAPKRSRLDSGVVSDNLWVEKPGMHVATGEREGGEKMSGFADDEERDLI